jgi:hypothetical protein
MRSTLRLGVILLLSGITGATAQALTLYGDSAGSNRIDAINPTTGAVIASCAGSKGNGRGMVVVGNIGYFTVADSNNVYKMDVTAMGAPGSTTPCVDLGVAFSVTGSSGLSTIAYDGTNFWIGDYSGTNNAYYYSPTGTLLKTIALSNCTSYCDGLEYFSGKLISNRGDTVGPYDVYDTNGNLMTANFIDSTVQTSTATGIAFDGTNFYVSDIYNGRAHVYNGTTGAFIQTVNYTGATGFLIEDLSFDYVQVLPTPTGTAPTAAVPTLSTPMLVLLGIAIVLVAFLVLRSWS